MILIYGVLPLSSRSVGWDPQFTLCERHRCKTQGSTRHREISLFGYPAVALRPFSPWQGEKVAVTPDEGVFADSFAFTTLNAEDIIPPTATVISPPAERRANSKMTLLAERIVTLALRVMLLILIQCTASAADPGTHERAFLRALELFDSATSPDDYRASARELESILADGVQSGAVYYNLGNAYYRAGEYGRAILNYRKAKPFRPRDPYLESNLQQALASAPGRLPEQPAPWWTHVLFWDDWISFRRKVQITGLCMILAATLFAAAAVLRRPRIHLGVAALCCVSLALGIDAFLSNPGSANRAVITGETIARKGTGKDYEPAFDQPLRDGAEFTVLSETADWTFGHFEGIGDGWVRNEFVAR
jgi:hypothetical protein